MRRVGVVHALSCAAFAAALAGAARADSNDAVTSAKNEITSVARNLSVVQVAVEQAKRERLTAEQRLANGELLYRTKDYARASVVLSEIIEEYPNTPNYPDALWLRGETYYGRGDYLAARRDYRMLADRFSDPQFQTYFGRALARLVDVSLRLDEPASSITPVADKFSQVPANQVDAGLLYAKGKAFFRLSSWSQAAAAFAAVPFPSDYAHQARYFLALVAMRVARSGAAAPPSSTPTSASIKTSAPPVNYKEAIEAFRAVGDLPPDSPDHRQVIDLAWMAVGRLFYETEQYQQASEAYSHVGRESPEFETMLYELAWVYVRLGDVARAERSLEVLMVSDPNSEYISDGTLLRADLLLRAGAFDRALALYQGVRSQYDPMRAKVAAFLDSTKDVSVYYDKLAQQQLALLDQKDQLPPTAVRWARDAEDGPLAFAVIDDVNECKALIHQSGELIDKLSALTGASTRVRAFPELEAGERAALGFINRISQARYTLARALDVEEPDELSGAIVEVRRQRRALMGAIADLPIGPADFEGREQQGQAQWNTLSQELTRRSMEVDSLQATVNGLRRMLSDGPQQGVARDPASTARFQAELDANQHDLKRYQDSLAEARREVDMGRAQIGLGDARYQNDALVRDEFRDLLEREVALVVGGSAGSNPQPYGRQITPLLQQARVYEGQLVASVQAIETQVAARALDLQRKIDGERANVAGYQQTVQALDNDGRDLVGHVAERNFGIVRDKLRGIVLRSDVGITEQAWEVREEELDRVRSLQTERARQEQLLDEELKEVRDDGVEPAQPSN